MARYSRIEVVLEMARAGLVPVFYDSDSEVCKKVLKACYDGGSRIFEFTNRGDFAHEIFADLYKYVSSDLPGMMLGAGTIMDSGTASLFIQLGSNFIVSPVLLKDMASVCNRRKILWVPGCGTVNEISYAEELGAEIVKLFPAKQLGGPDFVKAVKAPCPWTNIMCTGGVERDEDSLHKWFTSGVTCVGMGSALLSKKNINEFGYDYIRDSVKKVLNVISAIRNKPDF